MEDNSIEKIEKSEGVDEKKELSCISNTSTKAFIQDEITWGLAYRSRKHEETKKPIPPKRSPINIPFKLCRESQRHYSIARETKLIQTTSLGGSGDRKVFKSKSVKSKAKPSLLDRSTMSQKKYMDLLSIPNEFPRMPCVKKRKRRPCCRCELEPCPPRIVELSVPRKRLILESWKAYKNVLPAEKIAFLNDLLHSNKNLDPKDARYYFKQLDRLKRKERLAKLKTKRKKRLVKERGDRQWINNETNETAKAMMEYIRHEPLFTLNYKQLMLSESILEKLERKKVLKKPRRTTKNAYRQTVIEISDKVSVWIDSLVKFVDMHTVQSEEEIVAVSSLLSMLGEEEEEEGSEMGTSEEYTEIEGQEGFAFEGEEGGEEEEEGEGKVREDGLEDLDQTALYEIEGMGEDLDFLNELSEDMLEKLIKILSNCSDEILAQPIDATKMPGVTFHDILERLKMLRDGLRPDMVSKPFLEQIMIDWARRNEPEQVDQKLLDKIHETAAILSEWLLSQADMNSVFGKEGIGELLKDITDNGGPLDVLMEEPTTSDLSEAGNEDDLLRKMEDEFDVMAGAAAETGLDETVIADLDITQEFDENYTELLTGTDVILDAQGLEKDREELDAQGKLQGVAERGDDGVAGVEDLAGGESVEAGEREAEVGTGGVEKEVALRSEGELEDGALRGKTAEELAELGEEGQSAEAVDADIDNRGIPGMIKGHKPSVVFEHSPDTVCCLSLKIWAVWLLEITHNAHSWTKWISSIIQKVREYAAVIRGDILLPGGEKKVLYKEEWRHFAKETEEMIVSWRQYSKHVKDLTEKIVDNFHNKKVNCCPKCLEDHLIKNVVTAHETLQALTEAMNCAGYWQRCLDEILEQTMMLTNIDMTANHDAEVEADKTTLSTGTSLIEIEEIYHTAQISQGVISDESLYEIERMDSSDFS